MDEYQKARLAIEESRLLLERYRLAAQYTARYQSLLVPMSQYIIDGETTSSGGEESPLNRAVDLSVIHAYIDLCAEELSIQKQVPETVWQNWQQGILEGFRKPAIQAVWRGLQSQGMYADLREFLRNNGVTD